MSEEATTAVAVTIRSEWLRSYVRDRGGRLYVITGLFVVG